MKNIKLFFLTVVFMISGCTVNYSSSYSIDYGHSVYYQIADTSICFGHDSFDEVSFRQQVLCDTIPNLKHEILNPKDENDIVLIDGFSDYKDKTSSSTYYYSKENVCRIINKDVAREIPCDSYYK